MNTFSKTDEFLLFCLENYRSANRLSGKLALDDFQTFHVFDYLKSGYDLLHTQSKDYIISEINLYIAQRR